MQDNSQQAETIQHLRDEIAILKGEKAKPKFKPSGMDEKAGTEAGNDAENDTADNNKKRAGWQKRSKKKNLPIHKTQIVVPQKQIPEGSILKGYDDFVVQDIRFEAHNIRYRREIRLTPDGNWLRGELPAYQKG